MGKKDNIERSPKRHGKSHNYGYVIAFFIFSDIRVIITALKLTALTVLLRGEDLRNGFNPRTKRYEGHLFQVSCLLFFLSYVFRRASSTTLTVRFFRIDSTTSRFIALHGALSHLDLHKCNKSTFS